MRETDLIKQFTRITGCSEAHARAVYIHRHLLSPEDLQRAIHSLRSLTPKWEERPVSAEAKSRPQPSHEGHPVRPRLQDLSTARQKAAAHS